MTNLNQVIMQGNLVDDPKVMGEESNVVRFTIACNIGFGDRKETTFVDCVGFGKQAPVIGQHVKKGKQIIIRGALIQSKWEDKETGANRSKHEVRLEMVNGFFFTGNANNNDAEASQPETANAGAEGADGKLF